MIKRLGHGFGVDWWALGMVLYEMLVGIPPWYKKGQDRETIFSRIVNEPPAFPRLLSEDAKDIISGFLQKDPLKRLGVRGADGGREILQHPFFGHIDWRGLYELKVPPPAKPPTDNGVNAIHFDKKFTTLPIDIPSESSSLSASPGRFPCFTFTAREYRRLDRSEKAGVAASDAVASAATVSSAVENGE